MDAVDLIFNLLFLIFGVVLIAGTNFSWADDSFLVKL